MCTARWLENIRSLINHDTTTPPQVLRADGVKREERSQKIGTPPQVEIANIQGFQILGMVSFERALPEDLKTYVHWQTTIPLYLHKYWETIEPKDRYTTTGWNSQYPRLSKLGNCQSWVCTATWLENLCSLVNYNTTTPLQVLKKSQKTGAPPQVLRTSQKASAPPQVLKRSWKTGALSQILRTSKKTGASPQVLKTKSKDRRLITSIENGAER